ncbi:TrkH family potassium uptake protein [uncultured Paracoccus sp.]|uniref:TrkH family potassium uptake protein n=1 Tax=uncultured Paracoccus sp. TaxID=189685 RepID=UPI0025D9E8B6|nr:TrkH family potassium uptake protein [uncultured Paracoccus sp.]
MTQFAPVANIIGRLVVALGAAMGLPMLVDMGRGDPNWLAFLECGALCMVLGGVVATATNRTRAGLDVRQAFVVTAGLWLVLPLAGALPFMLGAPGAGFTDAVFEAMSGMTTTGTTAFPVLEGLPHGTHLWRAMLQWMGGLGIIVVAMLFLPVMKVGGMQFFRTEGFDTMGKILPRAGEIAREIALVYIAMTTVCAVVFVLLGMTGFDAVIHALSACSTGGFSNHDAGFGTYPGAPQVAASVFMVLAALPFIRMVQLLRGTARPLLQDVQVRAYLRWLAYVAATIVAWRLAQGAGPWGAVVVDTVFNTVSTATGTGFVAGDISAWGQFPFALVIVIGLVGGCTGSTACAIKVFRFLVLFRAIRAQVRRMHSPHRVITMKLQGRPLEPEVVSSVMAFFTMFMLTFGLLIVALALTGLHPRTALTGAWSSIANVGPVWGPEVGANGAINLFPAAAKWLMVTGMYLGRLELLAVLVLFLPRFWRR